MIQILVIAGLVGVAVAALVVGPLLFARGRAADRATQDAAVFRDQLEELERDRERGLVSEEEADGTRAEISRRLIQAVKRAERSDAQGPAPRWLSGLVAGLGLGALPAVAAVVYLANGAPGEPDRPFALRAEAGGFAEAGRPTQAEAEARIAAENRDPRLEPETDAAAQYARLIERLEGIVAERPEDVEGRRLLANGYMRMQRFGDAWRAYDELIELKGPRAGAEDFARKAEAMVLAAGGYVSPGAGQAIRTAMRLGPENPRARFLEGLRSAQAGRLEAALAVWEPLAEDAPEDARWRPWLEQMLAEAQRQAGRAPAGAAPAPGPDAGQVAAARDMAPEEREAMIEGMVARLEDRLTSTGGGPEEWVRLMNAYRVLGRMDEARRVYDLSQDALSGSEAGFVRQQALALGVVDG